MARFTPGAEERTGGNYIYVSLRTGRICQTSDKELEGYKPAFTVNRDETRNNFFAKEYDHIVGHVQDITWRMRELNDGTKLGGWNIKIDAAEAGVFILEVKTMDRPYHWFMNCLLNADFNEPLYLRGFATEYKGKTQKGLFMSQELDDNNEAIMLQPAYAERWLSTEIKAKLLAGEAIDSKEEKNVARDLDGKFDDTYPYVRQKADGKWSFDAWDDFLYQKMLSDVIPAMKAAAANRPSSNADFSGPVPEDVPVSQVIEEPAIQGEPVFENPAPTTAPPDDDIPF